MSSTSLHESPPVAPGDASSFPIRLADEATFAAARALFARAEFDERTVARRMGGVRLFGFPRLCDGRTTVAGPVEDANAALIRMLVDGEPLEEAVARRHCGDEGVDALRALGVLAPLPDGRLEATVMLAPLAGTWIASDKPARPDVQRQLPRDVVFTAHNDLTKEFLAVLPGMPGARVLELCAGTGVAALVAARHGAAEAWATDIGARSTHFARFNARLSGLANVRCEVSDVWSAAEGETFDAVVAHPPYVPSFANEVEFRDAGADGEEITARIVAGVPAHLRRDGRCIINCVMTDREGEPVEARIRRWLGDASPEFDVAVIVRREFDQLNAYRSATRGGANWVDAERWMRHFDALRIERFALCAIEMRREAGSRAAVTVRRDGGPALDAPAIDWALRWARFAAAHPTPAARVGTRRPRVVAGTELDLKLRADADGWRTIAGAVMTTYPVKTMSQLPSLAPTLLELCDGTRDAEAILGALRTAGLVTADVAADHVVRLLDLLLEAGALQVPDVPVPARRVEAAAAAAPPHPATTATSSEPTQSTRQ